MPVTSANDVLCSLGITPAQKHLILAADPEEKAILDLLAADISDTATLLEESSLSISQFNQTLTMLEITGKIRGLGNNQWTIRQ